MKVGREVAPTGLRIPVDLKKWLKDQAAKNGRSLNSEIIHRLESTRRARREAS